MNMMAFNYAATAAKFETLVIANELFTQGNTVYFSMTAANHADVYITLAVNANHKADSFEWNNTSDPQNAFDVDFDSLEVDLNSRPIIDDVSHIAAVQGQPVQLTDDQVLALNEMLKEHFIGEKVREFGVAA